jgi:hypothetical protein
MHASCRLFLALICLLPLLLPAQSDTLQTRVYFDVGKSALRADARASLDALVARRGQAQWGQVQLTGRTDFTGDSLSNLRLSERRIASVQAYLAEKGGLQPRQFKVQALGKSSPLADNQSPAGKSMNRSVSVQCQLLTVTQPQVLPAPPALPPLRVDTIPLPPKQPYDPDCTKDTTIILPKGTRLAFNRCEYLELKPCLEFEEALSARDAIARGLNTEDSLGRTLESCGMIRITLKPGCSPKDCFKHAILVKTPVPKEDCNSCVEPPTLFEITQRMSWGPPRQESPKIEIVKEKGKEYYQYELRCPGGWKNCDCLSEGPRIKIKAPRRHKIEFVRLSMDCPMIVLTKSPHPKRRPHVVKFHIPCPNSKLSYAYRMVAPDGKVTEGENKPLEKLRAKQPVRECKNHRGKRIKRVLGIFPVYRHKLYHKYFLVNKKKPKKR